jgi:hypothetical protein
VNLDEATSGSSASAPSPALALAAAAGEDLPVRDRFIARAAATGDGVATIAEHLGLSRQQVHAILDKQRQVADPLSPATSEELSAWRQTEHALDAISSGEHFEALVQVLLGDIDTAIRPLGGTGDRARDAVADLGPGDGSVYSISIERQWSRKVRREVVRILEFGHRPPYVYAITNRRTTRKAEQKLEDWAQSLGITLRVLGQRWLVVKLMHPSYLELRREMLHLEPPRPTVFHDSGSYRELLNGRPANQGLDVPRVGSDDLASSVRQHLDANRGLVLYGPGGAGKTRLVLDLAAQAPVGEQWRFLDDLTAVREDGLGELGGSHELVVVIDNAHRRNDLSMVLALLERRRPRPKVVFVVRPSHVEAIERTAASVWLGPISADDYILVRGLRNEDVVTLVRGPRFNLAYGAMIRAVVQLAEGNPLIAILAAGLARDGQSIAELSRAAVFAEHVSALLGNLTERSAEPRQLREVLALVSALGSLDSNDDGIVSRVADLVGFAPRAVRSWLLELADLGLLVEGQSGIYAIKPDLLAEHVLVASFFSRRWRAELSYEQALAALSSSLRDLSAAVGRVPYGVLDRFHPGMQALRARLSPILSEGDVALGAELVRLALPGAEDALLHDLEGLIERIEQSPDELTLHVAKNLIGATQRVGANVRAGWQLLLRIAAAASDAEAQDEARTAMQSIYRRVPVDSSARDGQVLGMVQQTIAQATRSYARGAKTPGQLRAAAMAGQALLTVIFEDTQHSLEGGHQLDMRAYALPASAQTENALDVGIETLINTFVAVNDHERLRELESATELARRAAGFTGPFGLQLEANARHVAHQVLEKFDAFIRQHLEEFSMPVQAEAVGYMLRRRDWFARTEEHDGTHSATPLAAPARSQELDEYLFLIHPNDVEPPSEHYSWDEEQRRMRAQTVQLAQVLADDPAWHSRIARWEQWAQDTSRLFPKSALPTSPGGVFAAIAEVAPGRAVEIIDHLITTDSRLRFGLPAALHRLVATNVVDETTLGRWLDHDEDARAFIAVAIGDIDSELPVRLFRQLAHDPSETVRRAALNGLRYGSTTSEWKIELGLEIARDLRDGNALHSVLLVAEIAGLPMTPRLSRIAREALLASADVERVNEHNLIETLNKLEPHSRELLFSWIWRRVDWLAQRDTRAWMLDLLPGGLAALVREHAGGAELRQTVQRFADADLNGLATEALVDLLNWIDPGAPELTKFIIDNIDEPDLQRQAHRLLGLDLTWEQCQARAAVLADELGDEEILGHLIRNMLPSTWSGSWIPHLENALAHLTEWQTTPAQPSLYRAVAVELERLTRSIEAERERDRREDELELWH